MRASPWKDFAGIDRLKDFAGIDRLKHHFKGETADINNSYSANEICITSWKQINRPGPYFTGVIASVLAALLA